MPLRVQGRRSRDTEEHLYTETGVSYEDAYRTRAQSSLRFVESRGRKGVA